MMSAHAPAPTTPASAPPGIDIAAQQQRLRNLLGVGGHERWRFASLGNVNTLRGSSTPITWGSPFTQQAEREMHAALSARQRRQAAARAKARALHAVLEKRWDPSTHKTCPYALRGIKPQTPEPWSRDAAIYAAKTGSFEDVLNDDEEYNDESVLDSINVEKAPGQGYAGAYRSQVTATGLAKNSSLGGQPLWDSSPMRYTPHALRGIVPITREPWAIDEAVYNADTTRDTRGEERAGGGALDLGSISHATRARARQVDRPSFYMPDWEKWAALLSA